MIALVILGLQGARFTEIVPILACIPDEATARLTAFTKGSSVSLGFWTLS